MVCITGGVAFNPSMHYDTNISDQASRNGSSWHKTHLIANVKYFGFRVQDLLSVSCKMMLIKLFVNGKIQFLLLDDIIS